MRSDLLRPKIIEALQRAVQRKGINEVALELELGRSSLYNSLNPYGDRSVSQMGLERAIAIMRFTGDKTALALIAGELGCDIIERREPNKPTVPQETLQDFNALNALSQAMERDAGAEEVHRLTMGVHSEIEQTVSLYLRNREERRRS
jgi:hypothetical protein